MKGFRAFVIAGFGLAGCATLPPETATLPVSDYFKLEGRISVRSERGSESASIRWQRTASEERIQVLTPLGSQVAELSQHQGGMAELNQGENKPVQKAESIAALTQTLFGVPIDTAQIAHWVQGNGLIESQASTMTTSDGSKWNVKAEKFQIIRQHRVATRLTAVSGDKTIRLVIDEWEPLP